MTCRKKKKSHFIDVILIMRLFRNWFLFNVIRFPWTFDFWWEKFNLTLHHFVLFCVFQKKWKISHLSVTPPNVCEKFHINIISSRNCFCYYLNEWRLCIVNFRIKSGNQCFSYQTPPLFRFTVKHQASPSIQSTLILIIMLDACWCVKWKIHFHFLQLI